MKRRRFYSKLNRTYTLRAGATFALCELSCEKYSLPTTVQIRPEIWTNKLKKRDFLLLDRFRALRESCVSDQSCRIFFSFPPNSRHLTTDGTIGCLQRLLFASQLTQRKSSLCSQGTGLTHAIQKAYCPVEWADLGHVHTNPDIFETVYFFTRIGLLFTRKQWIRTRKPHCFETALQSGLRPHPRESG